jgi:hypothetical protein
MTLLVTLAVWCLVSLAVATALGVARWDTDQ